MTSGASGSESSSRDRAHSDGRRLGHFTLLEKIGEGAAASVYKALDNNMGRSVAVKVLVHSYNQETEHHDREVMRFQREARTIARLSHPNIVTIYEIGEQDGDHFLVMELLTGMTLRERLNLGPIGLTEATDIVHQIASGLDAIHRENIVHRDIKPSNVMLLPPSQHNQAQVVKLLDFGVARLNEDATITHAGALIGSPAYMSPEQALGKPITARSDIWSLGVLLYEMLSGKPPFEAPTILNVLDRIRADDAAPLVGSAAAANVVIKRALSKDANDRYETAGQLATALSNAQEAPPLTAPEPVFAPHLLDAPTVNSASVTSSSGFPSRLDAKSRSRSKRGPMILVGVVLAGLATVVPLTLKRGTLVKPSAGSAIRRDKSLATNVVGGKPEAGGESDMISGTDMKRDEVEEIYRKQGILGLSVLRNEPFARRGYRFSGKAEVAKQVARHYAALQWYKPTTTNQDAVWNSLTERERRNIELIKSVESEHNSK